jgi:nucleoside-diphosphate-sugar epimerase
MKVLIVGGTGFLGTEVSQLLLEEGHQVRSLNRRYVSGYLGEQVIADISDIPELQQQLSLWKPEIVIQAAWISNQKTYRESSENVFYSIQTIRLAEVAMRHGISQFIGLGTCAEYGLTRIPCNAAHMKPQPVDSYGREKLKTFESISELANRYPTDFAWARIFQPYGKYQDSSRLLPFAISRFKDKKQFKPSNPETVLDWISSRDIASALSFIIRHKINGALDVGTSLGYSVQEILTRSLRILGLSDDLLVVKCLVDSHQQQPLVVAKNSPLFLAGWVPNDDLDSGLTWTMS